MEPITALVDQVYSSVIALPQARTLIAIAGPPASGKSTLAEALQERFMKTENHAVSFPWTVSLNNILSARSARNARRTGDL